MRIVLTGSSTGIGRALAERLLARGHHVWGLARSDQSDFAARNPNFHSSRGDVADWTQVAQAVRDVSAVWDRLDALIACAGLQGEIGPAVSADPLRWSATVRANLDGTYFAIRGFHALLAVAPRAKIICFSGGGATKPRTRFSAYGVAKTGVVRLVETIAEEERGRALDINAIAPGAINTRLTDEVLALGPKVAGKAEYDAALKTKLGAVPSDLSAKASTTAEASAKAGASLEKALGLVEWLLSPASNGISGRLLAAPWDPWPTLDQHAAELAASDIYTLRRILPGDRSQTWE